MPRNEEKVAGFRLPFLMLVQMAEATAQHVAGLAADNKCTGIHLHGKLSHLVKLGFADHAEDNIFLGMLVAPFALENSHPSMKIL